VFIALLTDFGTQDYFVGAMKGAILSINENAQIVDITHDIEPQSIESAGFILRACYKNFPKKTIFVAVVDPGVGSGRRAILVETEDYYFVAPDDGLLSFVFDEAESFRVFELTDRKYFAEKVSATFHGRDIFAPVAAHLSRGVSPNEFGTEITDFIHNSTDDNPQIIHIDRFGNLITNLKKENLPEKFYIEINGRRIEKLQKFYAEAEKSEVFMILGSAGFLEIVAFKNSAQKILSAESGQTIYIKEL
jgi:S-adenosyl-L-methionine hydrolase (adenosine-forming)